MYPKTLYLVFMTRNLSCTKSSCYAIQLVKNSGPSFKLHVTHQLGELVFHIGFRSVRVNTVRNLHFTLAFGTLIQNLRNLVRTRESSGLSFKVEVLSLLPLSLFMSIRTTALAPRKSCSSRVHTLLVFRRSWVHLSTWRRPTLTCFSCFPQSDEANVKMVL
jgi:hypothetical protein